MILHYGYIGETDSLRLIRDSLELEETVGALRKKTAQEAYIFFQGDGRVDHAPAENYVVCHGMLGMTFEWTEDRFADDLIARGIRSGDVLRLITCTAGAQTGVAERLAAQLGARGATGVFVHGPEHYIHWNANGEILVTGYKSKDAGIQAANKAWGRAEDAAWRKYIAMLKAYSCDAFTAASAIAPDTAADLIYQFADKRPDGNKQNAINALVAKAKQDKLTDGLVRSILGQSIPVPRIVLNELDRERTHEGWSLELRTLLTGLHGLADPATGPQTAAARVTECRRQLRKALADKWSTYSTDYFDRLRSITTGTDAQSRWLTYTSAPPALTAPVQVPRQVAPTVVDDDELARLMAELGL